VELGRAQLYKPVDTA